MIYGIGVDIEEVNRIKAVIKGREKFLERFFSDAECEMFARRNFKPDTICGNFCAKEAFVKALGTGFRSISLKSIEVLRNDLGMPYYRFDSDIQQKLDEMGLKAYVSLSHTDTTAVAYAIIEKL